MQQRKKIRAMLLSALFAAIIGILAQVVIPLPLIPITGQTLAIGLAATILGSKLGTLAVILYLAMGAIGMPVFESFTGGMWKFVSPTGGYLVGFLPTAFIIGFILEKWGFTYVKAIVANIIGMIITLLFGAVWLKFGSNLSWAVAISSGVTPFIIVGIVKGILAAWIGILVRNRLGYQLSFVLSEKA